jgi:hypothetical protein
MLTGRSSLRVWCDLGREGVSRLGGWLARPAGACLSFFLLIVVVVGRPWEYWDLPQGDTAYYYRAAGSLVSQGRFGGPSHLVFSPVYLTFFAGVRLLFSDPHAAVIVQRYLTLVLAGGTVLLCARRVLPSPWSWLAAAWWMVVPENSRPVFEVHVFSFALFAAGCWLAGGGRLARGWGLAVLVLVSLGLRNELAPAAGLFFLLAALYEWRARPPSPVVPLWRRWLELSGPSLLVVLLAVVVARTRLDSGSWRDVPASFRARQQMNLSQVFAFGYQQRHPEWGKSPWTESGELMQEVFGKPMPTVGEAWRAHPRALWEHMQWNFRLLPEGLQLALLGAHSGTSAPDFGAPQRGGNWMVLAGSAGLVLLWLSGLAFIRRPAWAWLDETRHWTWVALATGIPSTLVAIATQRPRPSYMYGTTFLLLLGTVWVAAAWVTRWRSGRSLPPTATAGAIALSLALVAALASWPKPVRGVRNDVARLEPHRRLFSQKDQVFCTNRAWAQELTTYLSPPGKRRVRCVPLSRITSLVDANTSLGAALDQERVQALYLADDAVLDARLAPLVTGTLPGWRTAGLGDQRKSRWRILERESAASR